MVEVSYENFLFSVCKVKLSDFRIQFYNVFFLHNFNINQTKYQYFFISQNYYGMLLLVHGRKREQIERSERDSSMAGNIHVADSISYSSLVVFRILSISY